jgi:hypothetical protein
MSIRTDDIEWRPRDAAEAQLSLEMATSRLRSVGDARAVFLDIYLAVTRRVVDTLELRDHGGFLNPSWLAELTGRFAEDALVAVLASLNGEPVRSGAWRYSTAYSAAGVVLPSDDAMLGVNAHINHDLAHVVSNDLRARHPRMDAKLLARYKQDYFHVNQLLRASIPESLDLLVDRYHCPRTKRLLRLPMARTVMTEMVMALLLVWREHVWNDIEALLATNDARARAAIDARIEQRSTRIAQAICAPYMVSVLLRGIAPAPRTKPLHVRAAETLAA